MKHWLAMCLLVTANVFTNVTSLLAEDKPQDMLLKMGVYVMQVAQNDSRIDVAFHLKEGDPTPEQWQLLSRLDNILSLNLRGKKITDDDLKAIAGLKTLEKLHLEKTTLTDAAIVHLTQLDNLKYLNLYGTKVTDAGIKQLASLKKLQKLFLWETAVTDAGVAELQQSLPELKIIRGASLVPVVSPVAEDQAKMVEEKKVEEKKKDNSKEKPKQNNNKKEEAPPAKEKPATEKSTVEKP